MPPTAAPAAPAVSVMPPLIERRSGARLTSHRQRRLTVVVLTVIAVGFLIAVAGNVNAPFGDSYEGRNGGVWGEGSRAIREDGPIASGLGARHDTGLVYTRHPPLIYPITAVAELIGGEHPAATRAPSVLAAMATIALLYVLLRTIGLRRASAFAGVAVVSTTSMFTVYGPMPDTPMLGLPIGIAAVIAWLRRRQGRALPFRAELAIATAAALVAWQAVFIVLVIGAVEMVRARPVSDGLQPARRVAAAAPFVIGTAVGLATTLLWVVWASGGPGQLVDALSERSGVQGGIDYGGIASAQVIALVDLFGLAVLGLAVAVLSVRRDRFRAASALLLMAVFGYAAVTPTGASGHDYWLYWAIAPVAFGWALVADAVLDWGAERGAQVAGWGVAVSVVALMVLGWTGTSRAGQAIEQGTEAGRLVADVDLPPGQDELLTVGVINHLAAWIPYATGTDTGPLGDRPALERLAAESPEHVLLASTWCQADDDVCAAITGGGGVRTDHDYELVTAADAWGRVRND